MVEEASYWELADQALAVRPLVRSCALTSLNIGPHWETLLGRSFAESMYISCILAVLFPGLWIDELNSS